MRTVLQRVSKASVTVGDKIGICILVGISRTDTDDDVDYLVRKILNVRLFDNPETGKRWDKSVKDLNLEVLSVSQFTLHISFKGNKLDFHRAMNPQDAETLYNTFVSKLKNAYYDKKIKDCEFGAMMKVSIENDGPVTLTIDSNNRE